MASRALPLPFPLRIGTDICQISRIHRILRSARGPRFVRRVLTEEEQTSRPDRDPLSVVLRAAAESRERKGQNPTPQLPVEEDGDDGQSQQQLWKAAVFMAGRFAAKEAAIKAHPHRRLTFHEVVIRRTAAAAASNTTSQVLQLQQQQQQQQNDDRRWSGPPVAVIRAEDDAGHDREAALSISHDGDYATAVCMAFDPTASGAAEGGGCR